MTKKGHPQSAVIIPKGISIGGIRLRQRMSAKRRIIPPNSIESGIIFLKDAPIKKRLICGAIKPMKPTVPRVATATALAKHPIARELVLIFFVDSPKETAVSVPVARISK